MAETTERVFLWQSSLQPEIPAELRRKTPYSWSVFSLSIMNRTIMLLLLVISVLNFPSKIQGRRTGAPCSAVEIMTPNHGEMSATESPFRLSIELENNPEFVNTSCYEQNKRLRSISIN